MRKRKPAVRPLALTLLLTLAACSGDVRDTKIADIDMTDAHQVAQVAQKLEPDERAAFGMYVMNRTVGAMLMPGGEIVRADGKAPVTVREAIALAKVRKAKNDARSKLMAERNALVERHNVLMRDPPANMSDDCFDMTKAHAAPCDVGGLAEKDRPEWDRLEKQIADYDRRLKQAE
ncbi:MAG: hypothetical protein H6916_10875 [Novosphingobium sp.]|uniref:hypothetical protein n=1 Tax=Novosphingobium sp. TaxID=1874826 RepID=UPI001E05752D|nr:hypothetical protein [Novosphingobium sp.]MCB2058049.1 hypothetical protein [Novosphingobium sp.]MCP5387296.1 hypothetical protein [Novosphingobium sp.]